MSQPDELVHEMPEHFGEFHLSLGSIHVAKLQHDPRIGFRDEHVSQVPDRNRAASFILPDFREQSPYWSNHPELVHFGRRNESNTMLNDIGPNSRR